MQNMKFDFASLCPREQVGYFNPGPGIWSDSIRFLENVSGQQIASGIQRNGLKSLKHHTWEEFKSELDSSLPKKRAKRDVKSNETEMTFGDARQPVQ